MAENDYKILSKIYYNPSNPGGYSSVQALWHAARKKISKNNVIKFLKAQNTYTINRNRRKRFSRLHYEVNNINDIWQIDLIDFQSISSYNDNFKYLLVCIDVFSKFLWLERLKNKTAVEVLRAFKKINKNNQCKALMSDSGKEFLNKHFKAYLDSSGIVFFTNVDDNTHACIAERVILTFKQRLYKYFYYKKTFRYIDVYNKICDSYNSSYHSAIKMSPKSVNERNILEVYHNLKDKYKDKKNSSKVLRKGMYVRITKRQNVFVKGSRGRNFTEEVFKIRKVIKHKPTVYELEDLLGEIIRGKFYQHEIQNVEFDPEGVFEIDKIVKKRNRNGIRELLVTWLGWPNKFTSWINEKDII